MSFALKGDPGENFQICVYAPQSGRYQPLLHRLLSLRDSLIHEPATSDSAANERTNISYVNSDEIYLTVLPLAISPYGPCTHFIYPRSSYRPFTPVGLLSLCLILLITYRLYFLFPFFDTHVFLILRHIIFLVFNYFNIHIVYTNIYLFDNISFKRFFVSNFLLSSCIALFLSTRLSLSFHRCPQSSSSPALSSQLRNHLRAS